MTKSGIIFWKYLDSLQIAIATYLSGDHNALMQYLLGISFPTQVAQFWLKNVLFQIQRHNFDQKYPIANTRDMILAIFIKNYILNSLIVCLLLFKVFK